MNARDLTEALNGRWKGNRGWAHCPAHREKTPSLTIMDGKTRVVVKCFGGCPQADVIAALKANGIQLTDAKTRSRIHVQRLVKQEPEPTINCDKMLAEWSRATTDTMLFEYAETLSVSRRALVALGACYSGKHKAWAFPMRDESGKVIGIRLRWNDGQKKAVYGSKGGLFYPVQFPEREIVFVCEGPTDTAAVIAMGLVAIGRPSCDACVEMTVAFLRRVKCKLAVIVADADGPGKRGAKALAAAIKVPHKMWLPPCKDVREYVKNGGTSEALLAEVRDL